MGQLERIYLETDITSRELSENYLHMLNHLLIRRRSFTFEFPDELIFISDRAVQAIVRECDEANSSLKAQSLIALKAPSLLKSISK